MSPSLLAPVLLLVALASQATAEAPDSVPVFLWSSSPSTSPSALGSLSRQQFADLFDEKLKNDPFTVLFVEENLSVEDLSLRGDAGANPFAGIAAAVRQNKAEYLPAVRGPIHAINERFRDAPVSRVTLTEEGLSTERRLEEEPRLLVVRLKDAKEGEPRAHFLARHDAFVADMIEKLTEKHGEDGLVAVYTARMPSWILPERDESHRRSRRAVAADGNETDFYNFDNKVYVFAKEFLLKGGGDNSTKLTNPSAKPLQNLTDKGYKVGFKFDNGDVDFSIGRHPDGYWYVDSVSVTKDSKTTELKNQEVYAPLGFSFHCFRNLRFAGGNDTAMLQIDSFQIEPFFSTAGAMKFSKAYDCVPFFTIPIWSTLFVVFVLLFILFIGILMMMEIHTMDRFDDPKGKTITINVAE